MGLNQTERIAAVTDAPSRPPIRPLTLPPYPPEIVRAFPVLEEHMRRVNQAIADWVRALNVTQG